MSSAAASPVFDRTSSPTWVAIQRYMLRCCGVVLRDDQAYLADARLLPVAKEHGFSSVERFAFAATTAKPGDPLGVALIDAMTTHETLFFRDANMWKAMAQTVLPALLAKARNGGRVRVWSAACSTGQEPYSLAMLIAETAPELLPRFEIFASDVSPGAIAQAVAGSYSTMEVNRGLTAARVVRHFAHQTGQYHIRDELRAAVAWSVHNLLGTAPDPMQCDLVLCRNVLIYFGDCDRTAVVDRLFRACAVQGHVIVGATETLRAASLGPGVYRRER